jgi:hypothetical protein
MFTRPWAVVTETVAAIVDKAIQLSAITEFDLQFVDNFRDNKESLKVSSSIPYFFPYVMHFLAGRAARKQQITWRKSDLAVRPFL